MPQSIFEPVFVKTSREVLEELSAYGFWPWGVDRMKRESPLTMEEVRQALDNPPSAPLSPRMREISRVAEIVQEFSPDKARILYSSCENAIVDGNHTLAAALYVNHMPTLEVEHWARGLLPLVIPTTESNLRNDVCAQGRNVAANEYAAWEVETRNFTPHPFGEELTDFMPFPSDIFVHRSARCGRDAQSVFHLSRMLPKGQGRGPIGWKLHHYGSFTEIMGLQDALAVIESTIQSWDGIQVDGELNKRLSEMYVYPDFSLDC